MNKKSIFRSWKKGAILVTDAGWGDSGKGKTVTALDAQIGARTIGGHNAGHTVVADRGEFGLGLIPSTIIEPNTKSIIGQEVVINPSFLVEEIKKLQTAGFKVDPSRLIIDGRSSVVMFWHGIRDALSEEGKGKSAVGSLRLGVGWAYVDRMDRRGLRISDLVASDWKNRIRAEMADQNMVILEMARRVKLKTGSKTVVDCELDERKVIKNLEEAIKELRPYVGNTMKIIWEALDRGKRILFEDAHGAMLDVSQGSWPFTTGVQVGLGGVYRSFGGKAVRAIKRTVVSVKAYQTRVGGGPMPTEDKGDLGFYLQEKGAEKGTRSGRVRRCGPIDLPLIRYGLEVVGAGTDDEIALTKLDILDGLAEIKACVAYEHEGEKIAVLPRVDAEFLTEVKPVFKTFPGWLKDTTGIRKYGDLPIAAQKYVGYIQNVLGRKITMIGVGKHRDATILI